MDQKEANNNVTIMIGTGTYREGVNIVSNISLSGNGSITYRGVSLGAAILDGTDQYTG
jgi:hypothetical protein